MVLIYLYHGDLYSDLWKSDLCFRPPATVVTLWVASCKMLFILVYDLWSQNEKIRIIIIIIIIVELHTFQALQMKCYHQIFPATTICYYVPYKLLYNLHIQSVNKMLAKKLIDDKTRDYMNARRVAKVILDRHHGKEAGKTLKSLVLE